MHHALGAQHSIFGFGDRIDPKTWGALVEKYTHGSHYAYLVGPLGRRKEQESAAKKELDEQLVAMLCNHSDYPSAPAGRARSLTPRPMKAAFTDRSVRLREGLHGRSTLKQEGAAVSDDSWGHKGGCNCPVCKPFDLKPAGAPSHFVHSNRVHAVHQATPSSASTAPAARERWSRTHDSNGIHQAVHLNDESTYHSGNELEDQFKQALGRRARAQAPDRSQSEGPDRPAGGFSRSSSEETRKRRFSAQGEAGGRGGVALVLTPRATDPPISLRITSYKKADGEHKFGHSAQTEKLAVHWNQALYRYDTLAAKSSSRGPSRSQSEPPERRNPVSGDGMMEAERANRRPSRGRANNSSALAVITNQTVVAELAAGERAARMSADKCFRDLCAHTEDLKSRQAQELRGITEKKYHTLSTNMANSLRWDG